MDEPSLLQGRRAELGEAREPLGEGVGMQGTQQPLLGGLGLVPLCQCLAATPLFETPWQDLGESLTRVGSRSSQPFVG